MKGLSWYTARTQYHSLNGLNHKSVVLRFIESGKSKVKLHVHLISDQSFPSHLCIALSSGILMLVAEKRFLYLSDLLQGHREHL